MVINWACLSHFFCIFKHVFQNNLAHLYSLKSRSAIWNICTLCSLPPSQKKKKNLDFDALSICKKKISNTESSWQIIQISKTFGVGMGGGGGGGGGEVCVVWASGGSDKWIFLTKNSNSFFFFFFSFGGGGEYFSINWQEILIWQKILLFFFFFGGGGGLKGGGRVSVRAWTNV